MKAIHFPEVNVELAKDQPEYNTLPVFHDANDMAKPMTACFELSEEELKEITETKKLWFTQLTFGHSFRPVLLATKNPFIHQTQQS